MRTRAFWIAIIVFVTPGFVLAPAWWSGGLGPDEDDILYYIPIREYFQRCIVRGDFPLFNPWNGLGRPFLEDPQTALFYPATWLFAIFETWLAYPLHLWLHYSLALWGCYRLLRAQSLDPRAAIFGAVTFAFCGFMLAHRAHLTMQAAAAWLPIVLWRSEALRRTGFPSLLARSAQVASDPAALRRFAMPFLLLTCAIALQCFAGHVQMAALSFFAAVILTLAPRPITGSPPPWHRLRAFAWLLGAGLTAGGLFAVQWIPTLGYLRICDRADWSYYEFTDNSLSPASVLLMVFPFLFGQRTLNDWFASEYWGPSHQCEQTGYVGLVALVLAMFALRRPWRLDATRRPYGWLLGFGILLAIGRWGPLCPFLYWLPGSSLFRCPARALLLIDLALAALAASVVNDLVCDPTPLRARLRATIRDALAHPVAVAVIAIAALYAIAITGISLAPVDRKAALQAISPVSPAVWLPLLVAIGALLNVRRVVARWREPDAANLLIIFGLVDLAILGWNLDVPASRRSVAAIEAEATLLPWTAEFNGGVSRLWVATSRVGDKPGEYVNSLQRCIANTNLLARTMVLTDYGPLQPRSFADAFAMRPWGESDRVVELLADSRWRDAAAVGWILVCGEGLRAPADAFLRLTLPTGERLYQSRRFPRFVRGDDGEPLQWVWESVDRVRIERVFDAAGTGPAGAIGPQSSRWHVSLLSLPGWRVAAAGPAATLETAPDSLMLLVKPEDPAATHVTLEYRVPGLGVGVAISFGTAIALVAFAVVSRRE